MNSYQVLIYFSLALCAMNQQSTEETNSNPIPIENSAKEQEDCLKYVQDHDLTDYKEYLEYQRRFGKAYNCRDFVTRFLRYIKNKKTFDEFNRQGYSFTKGITYFTDLSEEERLSYLGVPENDPNPPREDPVPRAVADETAELKAVGRRLLAASSIEGAIFPRISVVTSEATCCKSNPFGVPCSKDWVSLGKVTPVKNQGGCGSCWAFAAVAAVESAYLIKSNKNLNLSEQELVSCSTSYGNHGCKGGWSHKALDYILSNKINVESAYPYWGTNAVCISPKSSKYPIKSRSIILPQSNMAIFLQALNRQPVAVAIKVVGSFFDYKNGIYDPAVDGAAAKTGINHAVLAVGWNAGCKPYIKIKNSWGTSWGIGGYINMKLPKVVIQNGPANIIGHTYNVYPNL